MYFNENIEKLTLDNEYFRKVLYTGSHSQLVLMSIAPHEDIGEEVHNVDQFFRIESGSAKAIVNGDVVELLDDSVLIVKAGETHNIINTGESSLKLYTIYSPAQHPDGTIHKTKQEALEHEDH